MNYSSIPLYKCTKALVWCKRFRHRCGYGVHSPFAFNLVTRVIFEKWPYYAFKELEEVRKNARRITNLSYLLVHPERVDQLLFRLVNYFSPQTVVELGTQMGVSSNYLKRAKATTFLSFDWESALNASQSRFVTSLLSSEEWIQYEKKEQVTAHLLALKSLDFVYFNTFMPEPDFFEACCQQSNAKTLFVIQGIYHTPAMQEWWKRLVADERVGITFDLYDVGLLFFDREKKKQHYKVNF